MRFLLILYLFIGLIPAYCQDIEKDEPAFLKEMNKPNGNYFKVLELYTTYDTEYKKYKQKEIDNKLKRGLVSDIKNKNPYRNTFKNWAKLYSNYHHEDGTIYSENEIEEQLKIAENLSKTKLQRNAVTNIPNYFSTTPYHATLTNWKYHGPMQVYSNGGGKVINHQANVRAFAQAKSNPNYLYSAVESGTIFVSKDKGITWHWATSSIPTGVIENVFAIGVSPVNENVAYAGSSTGTNASIYVTKDGGITWVKIGLTDFSNQPTMAGNGKDINKILVVNQSSNELDDIIYIASNRGVFKGVQINGEYKFKKVINYHAFDIVAKPGSNSIVYALTYDNSDKHTYFYKSNDKGENWTIKKTGWYNPVTQGQIASNYGARLAVTEANSEVVYSYLTSNRTNYSDGNFLGVYKSSDSGESWILPKLSGPGEGVPPNVGYNSNNVNPAVNSQGFYNCAIMVSQTDENKLILGATDAFKSDDGGKTFYMIGGWRAPYTILHADMQTFYTTNIGNGQYDYWITTDGGISLSNDFFATPEPSSISVRNMGLPSDYWGIDMGENNTIIFGGTYHNGNKYHSPNFLPKGSYTYTGDNEHSTGNVLPDNNERHVVGRSTNIIGSDILNVAGTNATGLNPFPREPYAGGGPVVKSQRDDYGYFYYAALETNPDQDFISNKMSFYKTDGTSNLSIYLGTLNYNNLRSRGAYVVYHKDPNYQYFVGAAGSVNTHDLIFSSTDGGKTWTQKNKAWNGSSTRISIDSDNPAILYAVRINTSSSDVLKVSHDYGNTWTSITTPNPSVRFNDIYPVKGIGGTFLLTGSQNTSKFYFYNNNNWIDYSDDFPLGANILEAMIQYRTNEIYVATKGFGVWYNKLPLEISNQMQPLIKITSDINRTNKTNHVFNIFETSNYVGKTVQNWLWEFPGSENVTNSNSANPNVVYNKYGKFDVKLTLNFTDGSSISKSFPSFIRILPFCDCTYPTAITNNLNNILVWIDGSNVSLNGFSSVKDKISGEEYIIGQSENVNVVNDPLYNNKPVISLSNGAYIDYKTLKNGKTFFIVNNIDPDSNVTHNFLFGSYSGYEFHSAGKLGPIFHPTYVTAYSKVNAAGGVSKINNVQKNFRSTNFSITPAIYSLRVGNNQAAATINNNSMDRGYTSQRWDGKIAEVLIFANQLSDTEMDAVYNYLKTKYNIQ